MRRTLVLSTLAVALSAAPVAAFAARAYTAAGAEIFAGPGEDYPVVAQLAGGVAVNVNGCLSDYSWCDVSLGGNRGWVYADDLTYPYRNRRVLIPEYGPQLGLPLVTFSLGNYWDRYYRGRPFYGERAQWEHHSWERNDRGHDQRDYRGNDAGRQNWRDQNWRDRQDARGRQDFRNGQGDHRDNQGRFDQNRVDEQRANQDRRNQNQDRANQQRAVQERVNQQRVNQETANQNRVNQPPRVEQTAPNYPRENGNEAGSK